MKHEEFQDLLEGYVDETLDRPTRRTVDSHLSECDECRAILDHVHPVDLSEYGTSTVDDRAMRRIVRRSILRTAVDAALVLVVGVLVLGLLSALIFQPLVINRGGRAANAVRASVDMATMLNPGAVVTGFQMQPGLVDRDISIEVLLPVGSGTHDLGPLEASLGALSLVRSDGGPPWGFIGPEGFDGSAVEQLSRLGEGTVATIMVSYDRPLSVDEAQQIADGAAHDIRVTWAGFDVSEPADAIPAWLPGQSLGYATCIGERDIPDEVFEATSSGFGRSMNSDPASIRTALEATRDGLANVLESPALTESVTDSIGAPPNELIRVMNRLNADDPGVVSLVMTGPSVELQAFLIDSGAANTARVLAVDFYNWSTPVCGR